VCFGTDGAMKRQILVPSPGLGLTDALSVEWNKTFHKQTISLQEARPCTPSCSEIRLDLHSLEIMEAQALDFDTVFGMVTEEGSELISNALKESLKGFVVAAEVWLTYRVR
jgi:hypothetical protein